MNNKDKNQRNSNNKNKKIRKLKRRVIGSDIFYTDTSPYAANKGKYY
jgi:anaerobic selenocysteine-containing dehydrogenase